MTTADAHRWPTAVTDRVGIDLRALAAFRILLGGCIAIDLLLLRIPGLTTFYADSGVLPRSALAETYPAFSALSLHALSGAGWVQLGLFIALLLAAVGLILGYRTRIATIAAVILLASMQARNPLVLTGGDTIMLALLVFALFLPTDARWALRPTTHAGTRAVSAATASVLLLTVMIYTTNGLLKLESDAWMAGEAVKRIAQVEGYWTPIGLAVAEHAVVLTLINYAWMGLLVAAPSLVLLRGTGRTLVAGGLLTAQIGMFVTLWIGVFPLVLFTAVVLFLPPPVWDAVEPRLVRPLADQIRSVQHDEQRPPPAAAEPMPETSVRSSEAATPRGKLIAAVVLLLLVPLTGWQVVGTGLVDSPVAEVDRGVTSANWAMFADAPSAQTWYVLQVEQSDGDHVDALRGGPPPVTTPPPSDGWLWLRYGNQLRGADERLFEPLAAFGCETGDDAVAVEVLRIDHPLEADGLVDDPVVSHLHDRDC